MNMNPSQNLILFLGISLVVVALFFAFPKKARVYYLAVINTAFYLLCDYKLFLLIFLDVLWSWWCAKKFETHKSKALLAFAVILLILPLAFFKYNNFFFEGISNIALRLGFENEFGAIKLLMPLGISYYIFKSISYVVDVYKGKYAAERDFFRFYTYITYFAEILCGPISRYNAFSEKYDNGMTYSREKLTEGFYLLLKGLFMKVVIADRLAGYTSDVFSSPASYGGLTLWAAAFFYTVEIYCDFGGYSFIANGISTMMGLNRCDNFNRPYFSQNIKEFWNRWHISLSSWLKDYVYIPLGGNRCSSLRRIFNVMAVFFVSGVWHGSGLNFIFWGLYHGIFNVLSPKKKYTGIKKFFSTLGTFIVVMFGWILFASDSLTNASAFYIRMFTKLNISSSALQKLVLPFTGDNTSIAFFIVVMIFIFIFFIRELYEEKKGISVYKEPSVIWQIVLLTLIILFGQFGASSFLYANF